MNNSPFLQRNYLRIAIGVTFIVGAVVFFAVGGLRFLNWQTVNHCRDAWQGWINAHPLLGALGFFIVYVCAAALSIPGAAALTVVGGSLFGLLGGTIVVSFASVTGATLAMLVARYLLRGVVEARFAPVMAKINRGIDRDGTRYLFGLRLVPAIPFFAINLVMGLTQMRTWTFAWVSQLGMLPGTIVYVNAGSQLMTVRNAGDLLSWRLLLAFAALALFPFAVKTAREAWDRRA